MLTLDFFPSGIYNDNYTYTQGGVMFGPDFYIDSIQNMKKVVTNQIFKDATLNKAAHAYIDAQTKFVKVVAGNAIDMAKYSVETLSTYWFPKKEGTA
jgi:hypothetical protein